MKELQKRSVMGLSVHWGEPYDDWLLECHRKGIGTHVVTLNAEMAMQADRDPALKAVLCQADLAIPDGAGIVLYFRIKGHRILRCPGIELAESLLAKL
ncbi:MAG: glycosyltransferase, partial [Leptolyngbya sp. SIO1D8]|nr:glycosyltransferase [Leptolyngbya sp. SIO1D8]